MIHFGLRLAQAAVLLEIGLGLGLGFESAARAKDPAPVVDPKSPAAVKLVARLREACATKPELLGILVQSGELAGGVLQISGTIDRQEQAAVLEAHSRRILDEEPALKALIPGGVSASGMPILPVRSTLLGKIRHDFATTSVIPGRLNFQQIRLDDFFFEPNGALKVIGLCVDQRAYLESLKDPGSIQGQIASAVSGRLKANPLPAGVAPGVLGRVSAGGVEFKANPARRLQVLAVVTPGLDELLYSNARFDEKGDLQFEGWLAKEEQRAAAAALFARPEIATAYARPGNVPPSEPAAAVAAMVVVPWRAAVLAGMQERFARPGNKGTNLDPLRYCRLDRAWFDYGDQGGGLRLHFEGVALSRGDPKAPNPIVPFLKPESLRQFKTAKPIEYNASSDLKRIPHPRRALQEKIAGEPAIDGVRVDDLFFGPRGETTLEGVWLGENQAALLDGLMQPVLAEQTGGKVGGPITHRFAAVPTDQILRDLRLKTAAAFDETSLQRLSFQLPDDSSPPAPVLQVSTPESRVKEVTAALAGWLRADERTEALKVPSVGLSVTGRPGSLLKEIRTLVAREPTLDGVRVDRAYFDESNVLTLSGLQDHDGQAIQALGQVPAAVAKVWPRQPPLAPARAGTFAIVPLAAKLEWLRKVLSLYRESDGVLLSRAYYGPDGVMTFGGRGAGVPAQNPVLEKLIGDLIKLDPRQHVKLALQIQPRDPEKSARLVGKSVESLTNGAIASVRIEDLDEAIFLDPNDSTAWYLRAAYYHARGDATSSDRDLRRVKRLESSFASRRTERFRMLTRFQGASRAVLDELELNLPNNP